MTTPENDVPDTSTQGEPDFVALNTTDGEVDAMRSPDDQPSQVDEQDRVKNDKETG